MKKFIVVGNMNAIIYKPFFPYMKRGEVCTGYNHIKLFSKPDGQLQKFGNICWFSNLTIYKENTMNLENTYTPDKYPTYDNYPAINCDKIKDMPGDYDGAIGVPLTIMEKMSTGGIIHLKWDYVVEKFRKGNDGKDLAIENYTPYTRIVIRKTDYSVEDLNNRYSVLDTAGRNDEAIKGHKFMTAINGQPKYPRVIIKKK